MIQNAKISSGCSSSPKFLIYTLSDTRASIGPASSLVSIAENGKIKNK